MGVELVAANRFVAAENHLSWMNCCCVPMVATEGIVYPGFLQASQKEFGTEFSESLPPWHLWPPGHWVNLVRQVSCLERLDRCRFKLHESLRQTNVISRPHVSFAIEV